MRAAFAWLALLPLLLAAAARAGQYNEVLSIGDDAPAWTDLPDTDGEKRSLEDLAHLDVVVVVFTCNSCPYAVDYEDRIIALARRLGNSGKAALVAINVNLVEEDRLPAMQERAREKRFPFWYLFDESQEIARQYGAAFTPQFFVLNQERKVVYMGAFDNDSDPEKVTQRYVHEALTAVLRGESPATQETPPVGCRIRWARRREE